MAELEKNISVLTKKIKQANDELLSSYKKIGSKFLLQMKEDESLALFLNNDAVISYEKLVQNRACTTKDILDIKSTSGRLDELDKFRRQVVKSIKDTEASQTKMKVRFSILLYKEHRHEISFASLENYNEIEKTESDIAELLLENETFTAEKQKAGFLAKFNLNRKIAGNRLKISILKRTLEKHISKHADDICDFSAVQALLDSQTNNELKKLYGKIVEQRKLKEDMNVCLDNIQEEADILANTLSDLSSGSSPSKKVSHLSQKVSMIDKEVDALIQTVAIDFIKSFISDDNKLIEEKKIANINIYQSYAEDLNDILQIRHEISMLNFNIEYCDVTRKKEETKYKITVMKNAISSCEEGIKNYQQRINALTANIEESSQDIKTMDERLSKLKALIQS